MIEKKNIRIMGMSKLRHGWNYEFYLLHVETKISLGCIFDEIILDSEISAK